MEPFGQLIGVVHGPLEHVAFDRPRPAGVLAARDGYSVAPASHPSHEPVVRDCCTTGEGWPVSQSRSPRCDLNYSYGKVAHSPERGDRCASEATDRLQELAGYSVRLEDGPRLKDQFDRILAYVYTADGISIDETLIRERLATAWTRDGQPQDTSR